MILFGISKKSICQETKLSLATGIAFEINNLDWSIAGNLQGQMPNVLSELQFKDITSRGIYIEGIYKPITALQVGVYLQHNKVVRGNGIDTDYETDNRTGLTYQELFHSNKGFKKVFNINAQYLLLKGNVFYFATGVDLGLISQDFNIQSQKFDHLNSRYKGIWKKAGINVSGKYKLYNKMSLTSTLFYGFVAFKAEADWNLIQIFQHPVSFRQEANGRELKGSLRVDYIVNRLVTFNITGMAGNMRVFNGVDISFLTNRNEISTKLNSANNHFRGFTIGPTFSF
jgi:hypothetical protein